mmetsp:Transcript_62883/g.147544  ORF Transcript_62883/g.147544 Transcript_62883/m.147544 type:complete len:102 (-) Transcript_62883:127-432(-)
MFQQAPVTKICSGLWRHPDWIRHPKQNFQGMLLAQTRTSRSVIFARYLARVCTTPSGPPPADAHLLEANLPLDAVIRHRQAQALYTVGWTRKGRHDIRCTR